MGPTLSRDAVEAANPEVLRSKVSDVVPRRQLVAVVNALTYAISVLNRLKGGGRSVRC